MPEDVLRTSSQQRQGVGQLWTPTDIHSGQNSQREQMPSKDSTYEFPRELDKSRDLGRCLSSGSANFCCCGRSVVLAATCALGWSVKARCRPHRPPQRGALDFQPAGNMVGFQRAIS